MSIGVMLFNPFTGRPRNPADIASDPHGVLVWDGEQPLRPAAQRQPLTDEQIDAIFESLEMKDGFWLSFARAIERAHGIGGEA